MGTLQEVNNWVLFGWAQIVGSPYDSQTVHKAVFSIGNNPYFKNAGVTLECHILHDFPEDFYGADLKVVIVGKMRSMDNIAINGLEELKELIQTDITEATTY